MRRPLGLALLIATAFLLVRGPAVSPRAAQAQALVNCDIASGDAPLSAEESAALAAINAYRQGRGLAALTPSRSLTRGARWKAAAMAAMPPGSELQHDDPNRTWDQRVRDCGYTPPEVDENLGAGAETAAELLDLWRNSPQHNANMLSSRGRVAGIGLARSAAGWFWVLVVGATVVNGDTLAAAPAGGGAPPGGAVPPAGGGAPPAGQAGSETVRLFTGCNLVALTWVTGTPASQVAAAVTPAGSLQVIWRFDNQAKRFTAFSPIPGAPSDFTTVNRNDAVYLCVGSDGQMQRPA